MKNLSFLIYVLFLGMLFSSCEKKVLELTTVLQVEKELRLPDEGAVKHLFFLTPQLGFAATDETGIYKTTDGGANWLHVDPYPEGTVEELHFFDTDRGVCYISGDIYKTDDGGSSWTNTGEGKFMGAGGDGKVITADNGFNGVDIMVSHDYGQTFQFLESTHVLMFMELKGYVDDSLGIVLTDDDEPGSIAINLYTGETDFHYEIPSSIKVYKEGSNAAAISADNSLLRKTSTSYSRAHYNHTYPYYGLDGYNDFIVAVGEKTITSNYVLGENDYWTEVYTEEGNGFSETFYSVEFINSNTFLIGGENGKIIKGSL